MIYYSIIHIFNKNSQFIFVLQTQRKVMNGNFQVKLLMISVVKIVPNVNMAL